jgi:hypothetical protein
VSAGQAPPAPGSAGPLARYERSVIDRINDFNDPRQEWRRLVALGRYDRGKADTVDATLTSAVRRSVAQADGGGAKKLRAALAEAQAGMGG